MRKTLLVLCAIVCIACCCMGMTACQKGNSAYDIYVENYISQYGNSDGLLSEKDWLDSLKGQNGANGVQGEKGETGETGDKGLSAYEIYCKYHPVYSGTEKEWIDALASGELAASYNTEYNIIFTLATIPPVLAALESFDSGLPTYALIERGKTYTGIEQIPNFYNIGFDVSNNTSTGFSESQFNLVVNKIKELNVYGNENFNIYVTDASGLWGFGLAANAQLNTEQFQVYLCEDGGKTYTQLKSNYIDGKNVNSVKDEPYEEMVAHSNSVNERVQQIMSKTDNKINELETGYYIAFPLSSFENVSFLMQDSTRVKNYLESCGEANYKTKLLSAIGFDGYNEETQISLNLEFSSINEKVDNLDEKEKENYLKLMYGKYFDNTYNTLMRTTLSDGITAVPSKKLVFISSRVKSYLNFATNRNGQADFGYKMATKADDVPDSYASLNEMYKTDFLFGTEADYNLFINQLKLTTNYNDNVLPEQSVLDAIKIDSFNYYIDYLFTLKFTYLKYGKDYDIILKGHPSEVIGEHETWTQHYAVQGYQYDKLYDNLLLAFHKDDSIGKYIGLVPFGTAAENLAYLGADISLCGMPSSTYTGYDQSVDIKFVMSMTDNSIENDINLNGRYTEGTLKDHDVNNNEIITAYFNIGNMYKQLIEYYSEGVGADSTYKAKYEELFKKWLKKVNNLAENADVSGYDVNAQGFLVVPE